MGLQLGKLKSVTEFLNDGLSAFENMEAGELFKAIAKASPWWLEALGETAKESLPLIGFVVKYAEKLTQESDPQKQGYVACTLAYSQAVEEAFRVEAQTIEPLLTNRIPKRGIQLPSMPENIEMLGFTMESAVSHSFVQHADETFRGFVDGVGLTEDGVINPLLRMVHRRFQDNLRMLLVHPDTAPKFAAFNDLLTSDSTDYLVHKALDQHVQYQWWLFNEARMFRQEPFSLAHVYLGMECGALRWGQIRPSSKAGVIAATIEKSLNPFSEQDAERVDLLKQVFEYIGDQDFKEPIIIQGVAGAGKSTFTLKLVTELREVGFTPLRICLKHYAVDRPLLEAIPLALRFKEQDYQPFGGNPDFDPAWFEKLPRNQEQIHYQGAILSPYVLIFDGWDEICTGANQGFKDVVDDVLNQIRSQFIDHRLGPSMRVIVTGRPSVDVTQTKLLRQQTPILTVRPLSPPQLEQYVDQFIAARFYQPSLLKPSDSDSGLTCQTQAKEWFSEVFPVYRQGFEAMLEDHRRGNVQDQDNAKLAVMGMPLLAYLAVRLMSQLEEQAQLTELVRNPTTLYRVLVDMTYEKGGKPEAADIEVENKYRITGETLRVLLWNTAEAITSAGGEEISREELRLRLPWDDERLQSLVKETTEDNVLSRLIISFFFKEGSDEQGCEFLHKSFREYLFAEGVVETLKQYGRDEKVAAQFARSDTSFPERTVAWKDFENLPAKQECDPRYDLTHRLAEIFATRWPTPEIKRYIIDLLEWEIERANTSADSIWPGTSTASLEFKEWQYIRDAVADVWDWWAEGVHLRPQPALKGRRQTPEFAPPYVVELVELSSPQDAEVWKQHIPQPARITTIDAHLGEAFFHLNAVIHAALIKASGLSSIRAATFHKSRLYQQLAVKEDVKVIVFNPSGEDRQYFANHCARINAAGLRPEGPFPSQIHSRFTFFLQVYLVGANLQRADLQEANLQRAILQRADLQRADLQRANLQRAILQRAYLQRAYLQRANLQRANLQRADLQQADLEEADLEEANLEGADLQRANLRGADLQRANLQRANLQRADLQRANLEEADLQRANLQGAILQRVILEGADLQRANLEGANLQRADLQRADLQRANLQRANLRGADLEEANLEGADLQRAILQGADLQRAILQGADLQRAYLEGANLQGADLQGADLQRANLRGAILQGADLEGADLEGADLQRADLQRAYLQRADLRGARNLTLEQVKSAIIENAIFDDSFQQQVQQSQESE